MIGDHADHNDELLDDQDWEDVPGVILFKPSKSKINT